jgi:hypothetical protein
VFYAKHINMKKFFTMTNEAPGSLKHAKLQPLAWAESSLETSSGCKPEPHKRKEASHGSAYSIFFVGTPSSLSVGMMLFPNLTLLDLAGPYEVFSRMPGARVSLVASSSSLVVSASSL